MPAKMPYLLVILLHGLFLSPVYAEKQSTTRFETTSATGITAVLEFAATPLTAMKVIPFRLELKNADGTSLTGADVHCNLTMPSMHMPENRQQVMARDGVYSGEIIFTCTQGAWRFACVVASDDGKPNNLAFDIPRVRLK